MMQVILHVGGVWEQGYTCSQEIPSLESYGWRTPKLGWEPLWTLAAILDLTIEVSSVGFYQFNWIQRV